MRLSEIDYDNACLFEDLCWQGTTPMQHLIKIFIEELEEIFNPQKQSDTSRMYTMAYLLENQIEDLHKTFLRFDIKRRAERCAK